MAQSTNRSAKIMEQRTSDAALSALEIIDDALSISSYSEKLLEMKAEALIMVCNYSTYFLNHLLLLLSYTVTVI